MSDTLKLFSLILLSQAASVYAGDCPSSLQSPGTSPVAIFTDTPLRRISQQFSEVSAQRFASAFQLHSQPLFHRSRTLEDLQNVQLNGGKLFLHESGAAGFGLTAEGEVISLFNASGMPGLGAAAVREALKQGARFLYCLDPLQSYFEGLGFEVEANLGFSNLGPEREELWLASGRPLPVRLRMRKIER